jgi:hypothetical protein
MAAAEFFETDVASRCQTDAAGRGAGRETRHLDGFVRYAAMLKTAVLAWPLLSVLTLL